MHKAAVFLLFFAVFASADDRNVRLGKYSCIVEQAHPNSGFPKSYVGDRLEYDADNGLLQLAQSLDIDGKKTWLPPAAICSALFVEADPSIEGVLHAVQFSRRSEGEFRPFLAWLKIDATKDEIRPHFTFFSTGIEGLVTGRCTHL